MIKSLCYWAWCSILQITFPSKVDVVQLLSHVQLFVTYGLQHTRLPCLSPSAGACSNSYPLCWWFHFLISSSVVCFCSCLPSFSASGSFLMSWLFALGGQSIGASPSAIVLPMNIQDWFPLGWTGCISLQPKRLSRVFSNTTVQKHQFFNDQFFFYSPTLTSIHDYWKNHSVN